MDSSTSQIDRSFIFGWILVNIVGLPFLLIPYNIGFFLMAGFAIMSDGGAARSVAFIAMGIGLVVLALTGVIVGAWLGFLQWLVLRRRVPQSGQWIRATAAGMAIGAPVGALLYALIFAVFVERPDGIYFSFAYEFLAFGPALGLAIGALQGSELRKWAQDAKWWVIGFPLLVTMGMLFAHLNRITNTFIMPIHGLTQRLATFFPTIKSIQVFFAFEIFTAATALVAVSLLSGMLLNWLLISHPKQEMIS